METLYLRSKLNRLLSYLMSVLCLYIHGQKSNSDRISSPDTGLKRYKSAAILSKAGRFFTVGASGFVVNYLVSYGVANFLNIWFIQATFYGIITSISTNFVLNKLWTFEDKDFSVTRFFRQYLTFLGLCAIGAIIQLSLVLFLVNYFHIRYEISLILGICVASIGNFILNKKITFGENIWE